MKLWICAAPENDLIGVLEANGVAFCRMDDPMAAWRASADGDALMLLADTYPVRPVLLPEAWLVAAREGSRRVYAEFFGAAEEAIDTVTLERTVVATGRFGAELPEGRILMAHDCHYFERNAVDPWLVAAKVAGFDFALFGLPEEVHPLLWRENDHMLAAATALSCFIRARYAPAEAWGVVWRHIIAFLTGAAAPVLHWESSVAPSFAADAPVGAPEMAAAIRRGAAWFENARLFVDPSWRGHYQTGANGYPDGVATAPIHAGLKPGDGTHGMIEGVNSAIFADGTQNYRFVMRADCMGEATMALALAAEACGEPRWRQYADNVSQYLYESSYFAQGPRSRPDSATYGLVAWMGNDVKNGVYYGDDNARMLLGSLGMAALTPDYPYLDTLARCLVGNMRTAGANGFRGERLEDDDMQLAGWRYYFDREITHYAPHFESWLWACYLWAYAHGGDTRFLSCAVNSIRNMMQAYPHNWHWTNGMQQERARMLLPLAWLVRVCDTPENRGMLERMVTELLQFQHSMGAIQEEVGSAGHGAYEPCASNEAYGTTEAPLIQSNDDELADLLYTTNFAFIGLHEAAAVTGRADWRLAEDRLAAFLTRIQVRSRLHPDLDGAWFRAFDFKRHDYWASNADPGWGAWSVESGWTQSWIVATLCLRLRQTSLWDLTAPLPITDALHRAEAAMLKT